MAGRDPILDRDVGEQGAAALQLTSHPIRGDDPIFAEQSGVFSRLLEYSFQLVTDILNREIDIPLTDGLNLLARYEPDNWIIRLLRAGGTGSRP
jgi:hypothetical protein